MTNEPPPKERFTDFYNTPPPWDIGRPQQPFVARAEEITGRLLDCGCGTGENALYFAGLGRDVTGIDFARPAIESAGKKAAERGLDVDFRIHDAMRLSKLDGRFDSIIDCGLFHVFPDDAQVLYVEQLADVINPGGRLFLMCFSDKEPEGEGPRRMSERQLRAAFGEGWSVESLTPERFAIRPEWAHLGFTAGGPRAWLAVIRRNAE